VILSNHVSELKDMVKALGRRDYFVKVNSSALMGYEKPNEKIFEKVHSEFGDLKDIAVETGSVLSAS